MRQRSTIEGVRFTPSENLPLLLGLVAGVRRNPDWVIKLFVGPLLNKMPAKFPALDRIFTRLLPEGG